ncbi:GroES-like protein [Artomyces pyxidatus]|uniref:GroES-like protein n=1 Tax=Artomyces pyxidatus TaxID=48021 RepID=A0ACB8TGY8_9AGAM|nr:GroES-like protein [Artomyces pyxidatus]
MAPTQQKALLIPERLADFVVGTRAVPSPGPGFVLVKIQAVSLNPVDNYLQKLGKFTPEFSDLTPGYPAVVGSDGAGIVEAVGEGVTHLEVGDRVLYQFRWSSDRSTFQQYGLADAARIAKIPGNVSFDGAATIPLGLATAAIGNYAKKSLRGGAALHRPWEDGGRGQYSSQAILVTGGSSSVGQFALQLAKLSGFGPIITTASAHNEAYCKAAGATHVVDYHSVPYAELPVVLARIAGGPIAFVYDVISSAESQAAGWASLAPGGSIVVTLPSAIGQPGVDAEDGRRIVWVSGNVHHRDNHELGQSLYSKLTELLAEGALKPNRVEVLPDGLAGIPPGLGRVLAKQVSGVKLVAHPQETL